MKQFLIIILLSISFSSLAQKNASLIISDQGYSVIRFVDKVELLGNNEYVYTQSILRNNRILFDNVQLGSYKLKYTTIFGDTLVSSINLDKSKKYKIALSEKELYKKVDFISQTESITEASQRIQLYIETQSGCLVSWTDQLFIYKSAGENLVYFYSSTYDQPKKLDYPTISRIEVSDEFQKGFSNFIQSAMTSKEECLSGPSGGTQSHAFIKYQDQIMEFNFCPTKLNEWTYLMELFKPKS